MRREAASRRGETAMLVFVKYDFRTAHNATRHSRFARAAICCSKCPRRDVTGHAAQLCATY
eukprot:4799922-Pleurochrysis_carterae.AAC.2